MIHRASKKTVQIVFVITCQVSTNFDNFLQKNDQNDMIMQVALIFHFTQFM